MESPTPSRQWFHCLLERSDWGITIASRNQWLESHWQGETLSPMTPCILRFQHFHFPLALISFLLGPLFFSWLSTPGMISLGYMPVVSEYCYSRHALHYFCCSSLCVLGACIPHWSWIWDCSKQECNHWSTEWKLQFIIIHALRSEAYSTTCPAENNAFRPDCSVTWTCEKCRH